MTGMVTLWQANEGSKVFRPSGFEIFQFFFNLVLISDKKMKFYFFTDAE